MVQGQNMSTCMSTNIHTETEQHIVIIIIMTNMVTAMSILMTLKNVIATITVTAKSAPAITIMIMTTVTAILILTVRATAAATVRKKMIPNVRSLPS